MNTGVQEDSGRLPGVPPVMLPALFTLGNLLCGCAAVGAALAADQAALPVLGTPVAALAFGAGAILLGMLFDVLDGLMARLVRCPSEFGAALDTLADVVTFGVAPAALLLSWALTAGSGAGQATGLLLQVAVVAGFFVACAALRLARFHALAGRGVRTKGVFIGLPTPAGAALVVAMLLRVLAEDPQWDASSKRAPALLSVTLLAGVLMVSRLRYPHLLRVLLGRHGLLARLMLVLPLFLVWHSASAALLACAASYAGLALLPRRGRSNAGLDAGSEQKGVAVARTETANQPQ